MRITKAIGAFLLMAVCLSAYTQEGEEKIVKNFNDKTSSVHEIGINSTFFINTFVSFNTVNPTIVSPYALTYRYRNGRGGLRFGIGGMYQETEDGDPDSDFKTTNGNVDVRLGGEFNTPLGNRWRVLVGGDMKIGYDVSSSRNGQGQNQVVTTSLETISFGGGPVVGIDFMVSKRIKLGTETSAAFMQSNEVQTVDFSNSVLNDSEDKTRSLGFTFDLPTSLYLILMF